MTPIPPIKVGQTLQLTGDLQINPLVTLRGGSLVTILEIWAIHDNCVYVPYFIIEDRDGHKTGVMADMLTR